MCGILFAVGNSITRRSFDQALNALSHRGPDASSSIDIENDAGSQVLVGHTRLKIIETGDLGNQPMWSKSGRVVLTYNGEIFNYRSLAISHGITLQTQTDTELLVELIDRLGSDAISHLEGMFAFVAYRPKTHEIIVARDQLGIKPLYVYSTKEEFIVSSEAHAIDRLVGPLPVNEEVREQIRSLRLIYDNQTPFRKIESFPAGHFQVNSFRRQYYTVPIDDRPPLLDSDINDQLEESVNLASSAAVPIGAFISGGVDSSLVASLANPEHLWTVGTDHQNEFREAEILANSLSLPITKARFETRALRTTVRALVHQLGHPLLVPNEVLIAHVSHIAQATTPVLLSGEGADEMFGGYDRIFRWAVNSSSFSLREFADLYCYTNDPDLEVVEAAIAPSLGFGDVALIVKHFFLTAHLRGLLERLDRASMSASVEARPALLGLKLVNSMARTHLRYQVSDTESKAQLRRIAEKRVGAEIARRAKVGFPLKTAEALGLPGESDYLAWSSFNWDVFESLKPNFK